MKKILLVSGIFISLQSSALQIFTKSIEITDQLSSNQAAELVKQSDCVVSYITKIRNTGPIFYQKPTVVLHSLILRPKDASSLFKISSGKQGDLGYGLAKIGAFSLPKCDDYTEGNE